MAGDFFIRRATPEDAPGILNCLAAAFEPYRTSYSPGGWLDTILTAETVQQRLSSMEILVAVSPDGVVGTIAFAVVDGTEGHLRGMAVLRAWQGRGVGE